MANLLAYSDQAKKEFKVEVEAIGPVRHKNLVREDAHAFNSDEETEDLKGTTLHALQLSPPHTVRIAVVGDM
ncbi:hypothetical protein PIB30_095780, partial [Stylosanthes scabra]|nr:hypothetical protein [Stylosanthes scabra]